MTTEVRAEINHRLHAIEMQLLGGGDIDGFTEEFDELARLAATDSERAKVLKLWGSHTARNGEWAKAARFFHDGLLLDLEHGQPQLLAWFYWNYAQLLMLQQHYGSAIQKANEAIRLLEEKERIGSRDYCDAVRVREQATKAKQMFQENRPDGEILAMILSTSLY